MPPLSASCSPRTKRPCAAALDAAPHPALTEHTLTEPAALDAELSRIRRDGVAISREEAVVGVVGLAVPVRDANGSLVAAVHISAFRAQLTDSVARDLTAAARATAAAMERELGRLDPTPTKLLAERAYWDNDGIIRQMKGEDTATAVMPWEGSR